MNRLELTVKGLRGRGKTTLLRIICKGLSEQGHDVILGPNAPSVILTEELDQNNPIQPMQIILYEDPNDLELPVAYTVGQLIDVLGHVSPDFKLCDKFLATGIQVIPQTTNKSVLISGNVPEVPSSHFHRGQHDKE